MSTISSFEKKAEHPLQQQKTGFPLDNFYRGGSICFVFTLAAMPAGLCIGVYFIDFSSKKEEIHETRDVR
jgi:hypothetical protein